MSYFASDLEAAFRAVDTTSQHMKNAIEKWYDMYYEKEATEESDPCQRIPYTIVRKLTKTAFSEYAASSKDAFASSVIQAADSKKQKAMHKALIGGISGLKPVPTKTGFRFSVVNRSGMLVFARDGDGVPIDIGTCEKSTFGQYYYTLLERRTVGFGGYLTIINKLYRSLDKGKLGNPAPLTELPQ